jgi:hypothetical protein
MSPIAKTSGCPAIVQSGWTGILPNGLALSCDTPAEMR